METVIMTSSTWLQIYNYQLNKLTKQHVIKYFELEMQSITMAPPTY